MSNIFDKLINLFFDDRSVSNKTPVGSLILVAGRDVDNHHAYESIITGAGYRYTGRYTLEDGKELTIEEKLELIIWDLNVNETAKERILSRIELYYDIPVLIFTDSKYAMNAEEAIAYPPHRHNAVKIQKPVTTEQLLALISQYLYEETSPLIKDKINEV